MSMAMVGTILLFGFAAYAAGSAHLFAPSPLAAADSGCQTFAQTGHTVCGDFLKYWQTNGGLTQQGYPISDVFDEKSDTDGIIRKVQYFERAVFEAHPENAPPNNVLLSLLGSQKYKAKYPANSNVPGPSVAPPASTGPKSQSSGSLSVTIYSISDPSPVSYKSKDGFRCVAFDIEIGNSGAKPLYVGASRSSLKSTDNRQYSDGGCGEQRPSLAPGDLPSGNKIRGWISFEVVSDARLATFGWKGDGTDAVTFAF